MKVLIAGANGKTGRLVLEQLFTRGQHVKALGRREEAVAQGSSRFVMISSLKTGYIRRMLEPLELVLPPL